MREREIMSTDYLKAMAVWLVAGDRTEYDEARDSDGRVTDLVAVRREYRTVLVGRYSEQRFSIRQNGRGKVLAWAGGGGYDRQGTALADAVGILFGIPQIDGAVGLSSVIDHAARHGVAVYSLSAALYALPTVDRETVN